MRRHHKKTCACCLPRRDELAIRALDWAKVEHRASQGIRMNRPLLFRIQHEDVMHHLRERPRLP